MTFRSDLAWFKTDWGNMNTTTTINPRNSKFDGKDQTTKDKMEEIRPEEMDSDEERHFYAWLQEAEKVGIVSEIEYHTGSIELSPRASMEKTIQLKTKQKTVDKFLLHPHSYTPDFVFTWHGPGCPFISTGKMIWVDVKGTFSKFGDGKQFSINQKWIFDKYKIFINKTVPQKLFLKTWVPELCRYTPKRHDPVKKYVGVGTVDDFMENYRLRKELRA